MASTKKDYEAVANVLSAVRGQRYLSRLSSVLEITIGIADYFESTNPRFDRNKFLLACMAQDGILADVAEIEGKNDGQ